MPDPITAVVGGSAVVGGIMSHKSAKKQASAAKAAARTQAQAADEATRLQREMFYKSREDLAPWREAGKKALNVLIDMMETGPGQFEASPGYQFRLQEGINALERGAAARGKLLSGPTQKALIRWGQDYATGDYDNFLRRYYDRLRPWQSLAGVGQTATGETGRLGANMAGNVARTNILAAQGIGNALLQAGRARASGYEGMATAANKGIENYFLMRRLNSPFAGPQFDPVTGAGANYLAYTPGVPDSWGNVLYGYG